MKNAKIYSLMALLCLLVSCTAEAIPNAAAPAGSAQDIGGQSGTVPPPPPPPKP